MIFWYLHDLHLTNLDKFEAFPKQRLTLLLIIVYNLFFSGLGGEFNSVSRPARWECNFWESEWMLLTMPYKRDYLHVWMAKEPILAMSKVAKKSIPLHPKEKNTVKQYHSEEDFTRSATGIKNMKNYLAQMLKDFEKHKFPITKEGVVRIAKDRFDKHTHTHNRKHSWLCVSSILSNIHSMGGWDVTLSCNNLRKVLFNAFLFIFICFFLPYLFHRGLRCQGPLE